MGRVCVVIQDHNTAFPVGMCVVLLQGQCACICVRVCGVCSKAKVVLVELFLQQLILLLLLSSDLVGQLFGNCF